MNISQHQQATETASNMFASLELKHTNWFAVDITKSL